MISKAKIKFIKSLQIKKYRTQEQCFIVEGAKSISELVQSDYVIQEVIGTTLYFSAHRDQFKDKNTLISIVTLEALQSLGSFQTNESALAVVKMKKNVDFKVQNNEFAIVLDNLRDPGNLGTIIRTADWYGITKIIASTTTTDFYSPKVIASTMGSFTRVAIYYTDVDKYLSNYHGKVYGTFLEGTDVHKVTFGPGGMIVIGNESKGISGSVEEFVTDRITIPRYGLAESLNAATATAIILDNVKRH